MSGTAVEVDNQINPWVSDDRLKEPRFLTKMELVIQTVHQITELLELLTEGIHMSKIESIPKLWDIVKDLKSESFKEL
jgi:hypothetical protein